jgi:hypothetical protein
MGVDVEVFDLACDRVVAHRRFCREVLEDHPLQLVQVSYTGYTQSH